MEKIDEPSMISGNFNMCEADTHIKQLVETRNHLKKRGET